MRSVKFVETGAWPIPVKWKMYGGMNDDYLQKWQPQTI